MEAKVRLNGSAQRISYHMAGKGIPLIFLHAFPLHSGMWQGQIAACAHGHLCLAIDLPGFGRSEAPLDRLTMDLAADTAAAVLDALDVIEPAVLVGLSMGGYASFAFWRRYPERVRALVLCDTRSQADTPEGRRGRLANAERARAEGAKAVGEAMLPKLLGRTTRERRPEVVERVWTMMAEADPQGVAAALEGLAERPDSTPTLATVRVPALVIVGAEDELTPPSDAEAMRRGIAGSRLVEIPAAGHLSNLEQPEAFNEALLGFLSGL